MTPLRDAAIAGDAEAFGAAYDLYAPQLYGVLLHLLGDADEAQYVLQQTFLSAWTDARSIAESRYSEAEWLMTVALNRALQQMRDATSPPAAGSATNAPLVSPPRSVRADLLSELREGGRAVTVERPLPRGPGRWILATAIAGLAVVAAIRFCYHA